MKIIRLLTLLLLAGTTFIACSDDENFSFPDPDPVARCAGYVIAQGNQTAGVPGAIDRLSRYDDSLFAVTGAFFATNGVSLGDSPQRAVVYGSKLYVPVFDSDLLWVLDKATLRIIKQIRTNAPEAVCADAGHIFIAGNDGYVSTLDTTDLEMKVRTAVGPNPAALTAVDGLVYVSISDGYNYEGGYANGCRVAVMSAATSEKLRDIAVGVNPGAICADVAGNLFVVCRGNYADIPSKVMKIAAGTSRVSDICAGSLIAVNGLRLYVLDAVTDWSAGTCDVASALYDTQSGNRVKDDLLTPAYRPGSPQAVDVDPATGDLYISTDASPYDYNREGYVYRYDREGHYLGRAAVGIHPVGVVFP